MAKTKRIERKPEYDAEDWETVGKLKEYVQGLGFTFVETEYHLNAADCAIVWLGSYASEVSFHKTIPGIVEWLKNFKHLKTVEIWSAVDDLRRLCELSGIQRLYFVDFNEKIHMDKFRGLGLWAWAETIQFVQFNRLLYVPTFIRKFQEVRELTFWHSVTSLSLPDWIAELPKLERLSLLRGCIHTFEGILHLFICKKLQLSTISQKSGTRRFLGRHAIHGFLRKSRFAQLSPELIAQNEIFL